MSIINTSTEYNKVQPRPSSERDNSHLLQSALKAASNDMAHRLLNYASLDKMDCEASCILIALANHQETQTTGLRQVGIFWYIVESNTSIGRTRQPEYNE